MRKIKQLPLTEEQQQFGEENYNLVRYFLARYNYANDDYLYDRIIDGYMYAIYIYFNNEKLHQYKFSTIFFNQIKSRLGHMRCQSLKRNNIVIVDVESTENSTLNIFENLSNDDDSFDDIYFNDYLNIIMPNLEREEKQIISMRIDGYNETETANEMNISPQRVSQRFCNIRNKLGYIRKQLEEA